MSEQDPNAWKNPDFRHHAIKKIEQAMRAFGSTLNKTAADLEHAAFERASSKEEYIRFVVRLISLLQSKSSRGRARNVPENQQVSSTTPDDSPQGSSRQNMGESMQQPAGGSSGASSTYRPPQMQTQATQSEFQAPMPHHAPSNRQVMMDQPGPSHRQVMMDQPGPSHRQAMMDQPGPSHHQAMMEQPGMSQQQALMEQLRDTHRQILIDQLGPNHRHLLMQQQAASNRQFHVQQQGPGYRQSLDPQTDLRRQILIEELQQAHVQASLRGQHVSRPRMQQQIRPMVDPMQMGHQVRHNFQAGQMMGGQPVPSHLQQPMAHPEHISEVYPPVINVTSNQFHGQSPVPAPSPGNYPRPPSNPQVPSPITLTSPSPQQPMTPYSMGTLPSPSSSLNTPLNNPGSCPSPHDDESYREKIRQMSRFIEPLRQMIAKMQREGQLDKVAKMSNLLEILTNPNVRASMDTLIRSEMALAKQLNLRRTDGNLPPPPPPPPSASTRVRDELTSPLLEAVNLCLQAPDPNDILFRTFGSHRETMFDRDIVGMPPPLKRQPVEEPTSDIPDVLQGEIARLDQKFKVSLDPAHVSGSKSIDLICYLDDCHLPTVPPISVIVPVDYPSTPPRFVTSEGDYSTTLLSRVLDILNASILKLPKKFSLSQLLDTWEMSVRQACSPSNRGVPLSTALFEI